MHNQFGEFLIGFSGKILYGTRSVCNCLQQVSVVCLLVNLVRISYRLQYSTGYTLEHPKQDLQSSFALYHLPSFKLSNFSAKQKLMIIWITNYFDKLRHCFIEKQLVFTVQTLNRSGEKVDKLKSTFYQAVPNEPSNCFVACNRIRSLIMRHTCGWKYLWVM